MSGMVKALVTMAAVAMSAAAEEMAHVHMFNYFDVDGIPGLGGEELEELAIHLGIDDDVDCTFDMGHFEDVRQGHPYRVLKSDVIHGVLVAIAVLKTEGVCLYRRREGSSLLWHAMQKGVGAWDGAGASAGTLGRKELMALYARLNANTYFTYHDVIFRSWKCRGASGVLDKHHIFDDTRLSDESTILIEIIEEFLVEASEGCPQLE